MVAVFLFLFLAGLLLVKVAAYLVRWYEVTGRPETRVPERLLGRLVRLLAGVPGFLGEYLATLVVAAIWVLEAPLRWVSRRFAQAPRKPPGTGRPIVLVHGFFLTPWSMALLRLRLARLGRPVYLLDYHPWYGDIPGFVDQLEALVNHLPDNADDKVDLVAHSMGGLIAARFVGHHPGRVRRLVAVGTPFHGTRLWAMSVGASLARMRPGSPFLNETLDPSRFPGETRVTSIYSRFDQIILPCESSVLPGEQTQNMVVDGLGHTALLFSPWAARLVVDAVRD